MSILKFAATKKVKLSMNRSSQQSMWQLITITLLVFGISSCSTYKSSFTCGNARGVECTSMDRVDYMIQSGEIERFNEEQQNRKYSASQGDSSIVPTVQKPQNAAINNKINEQVTKSNEIMDYNEVTNARN